MNFSIRMNEIEAQSFSEALSKKGVYNDYFINGNYAQFETSNDFSTVLEIYGEMMFRKGVKRGETLS